MRVIADPPSAQSLRWRLVVLLTLATLPAVVLMLLQAVSEYYRDRKDLERSLLRVANIAASEERDLIGGAKQLLITLASQPSVATMQQPACNQALRNTYIGLQTYDNIATFDINGRPLCSVKSIPEHVTVADFDWFKSVLSGEEFVLSDLVVSVITGRSVIVAAAPIFKGDGTLSGVLNTTIGSGWLTWLSQISETEVLSFSALVDRNGAPLDSQHLKSEQLAKFPSAESISNAVRNNVDVFLSKGRDGVERAYAIAPLIRERLFLLIARDESDLYGQVRFDLTAALLLPLIIWFGAIVCLWVGIQRLVLKWLTYLGRISQAYGAGKYSVRPEKIEDAPFEFQQLGQTMAAMATSIESRTAELQQALDEKNWLIREVNHRVKNNLQVVASLFNLQMRRISNPKAREVFADARNRLNALELVHRTLYETENIKEINLRFFLSELVSQLIKTRSGGTERVSFKHDIANIWVSPDKAVPIGLLVTEVVTNSLKHGFPDNRKGEINIEIDVSESGDATITISDNGIGGKVSKPGFGSQLIDAFVQQLGGEITVKFGAGVTTTVEVPKLVDVKDDLELEEVVV